MSGASENVLNRAVKRVAGVEPNIEPSRALEIKLEDALENVSGSASNVGTTRALDKALEHASNVVPNLTWNRASNGEVQTTGRMATRVGGWSLIVAAVGFVAVFSYLAQSFGYPDVLDARAAEVLPRLLALGATGRAVWVVYALLPMLLIPAAVGAGAKWREVAPNAVRAAVVLGVVAAGSMIMGLARWPTVRWELARAYATAWPDARVAMGALFDGLNVYLGRFVGEFLGEVALSGFFVLAAYPMVKARGRMKWIGYAGAVVGAIGVIAALRNVTTLVAPVAEVNNVLLPVWLVVLGVNSGEDQAITTRAASIDGTNAMPANDLSSRCLSKR